MERRRLAGIDLIRGLAIYGVVIQHADQGIETLPDSWALIRHFAAFAVPFFLATSFYLSASKLYTGKSYILSNRFIRLFIPYFFWSAFYLIYRALKYLAIHEPDRAKQLIHDPVSIFFFGGAAFHLYFLPLLLTGTVLMKLGEFVIQKRVSLKSLIILMIISLCVYEAVVRTENMTDIASGLAFQPLLALIFPAGSQNQLLRIVLVELAWTIRCLPYVLLAMLLTHPAIAPQLNRWVNHAMPLWVLTFAVTSLFGNLVLPASVQDVARGFTALFLALSISKVLPEYAIIQHLGFCSFGIYLIHLFFVETCQTIWIRLDPAYIHRVSTLTLIAVSIIIFLVSWGTTALLIRHKTVAKVLV